MNNNRGGVAGADLKRLFVPLSEAPYRWFEAGGKTFEMRRAQRAFKIEDLVPGRRVELHRGYSTPDFLMGSVGRIVVGDTIADVMAKVPYRKLVPLAKSEAEAVELASGILGPKPGPFVAFEVIVD